MDLEGWFIGDETGNHAVAGPLVVPSGGFRVLGRSTDPSANGGAQVHYAYGDAIALADASWSVRLLRPDLVLVDLVQWTSSTAGVAVGVIDPGSDDTDANGVNGSPQTTVYGDGDLGTPGSANDVP